MVVLGNAEFRQAAIWNQFNHSPKTISQAWIAVKSGRAVPQSLPAVTPPLHASEGELLFQFRNKKNRPALDQSEIQRQVAGHIAGINRILQTEGMSGLISRIDNWTPAVSDLAHSRVKSLGSAGANKHWLHFPDTRISNDPSLANVFGAGDDRVNSALGAMWKTLIRDIKRLPPETNWITAQVEIL